MKRWTVALALALPLPFAALPLVAVVLNHEGPGQGSGSPIVFEVAPVEPARATIEDQPASLGFRVNTEFADVGCAGDVYADS